ncbi:MAG TPA: hypothetical protein VFZ42_15160 [Chitinophagaceae bacterium]
MTSPASYFLSILLPFTYFFRTRVKTVAVLGYNFLNELLPNLIAGLSLAAYFFDSSIVLTWLLSYLAFIAFYEIGYYINDAYSVKKESNLARKRLTTSFSSIQLLLWIFIRLVCWSLITYWVVPGDKLIMWLSFYACLAVSFALHNVLDEKDRGASFVCLAFFRFFASGILIIPLAGLSALIPGVLLCYLMPRLWAYQESKGQLVIKERRQMKFKMVYLLIVSLVLLFIAIGMEMFIFITPALYFLLLTAFIWMASYFGLYNPRD